MADNSHTPDTMIDSAPVRDFFISYTSVDVNWAVWMAWILEEAGYSVFVQAWDILPGNNFVAEMQNAMTRTRKTIAVLSEDYFKSKYTKSEWTVAITRDPVGEARLFIPIKVKPCETQGFFATTVYIDITGRSEQDARAIILGAFSSRINADRFKPEKPPSFPGVESEKRFVEAPAAFPGVAAPESGNVTDKIIDISGSDDIMTAPIRQHLVSTKLTLTTEKRLRIYKNLDQLSLSQLNMLIFALNPPPGAVPPMPAPKDARIDALLRWAEGFSGRGLSEVQSVFDEMLRPSAQRVAQPTTAHRGHDVVKTCDRGKQEDDFNTFFNLCIGGRCGYAQFYITHGREKEGHKSLVERFCATTLSNHSRAAKPTPWEPGWPQTGNLKVDGDRLVSLLFEQAGRNDVPGELSVRAGAFRRIAATLPPVVVILHEIKARDWLHSTSKLIRSYIGFWDEFKRVESDATLPLFVVFLNITYPIFQDRSQALLRQWRLLRHRLMIARVRLGLWRLSRMNGRSPLIFPPQKSTSVAVLKELKCVTLEDVRDWLRKHRYGQYDAEFVEQSQNIFTKNKWELFECKSMSDVEWALSKFVIEMTPTTRTHT